MTDSRATFECKKHHLRQTNDGWIISLVVHPDDDMPDWLTKARLGTPLGVAIVPIDYDSPEPRAQQHKDDPVEALPIPDDWPRLTPAPEPPARKKREPVPFDELKPSQQAGILCADPEFQEFMCHSNEENTAIAVRTHCHVASRAEIDGYPPAAQRWHDIVNQFRDWQRTDARYKDTPAYEKARTEGR